MNQTLLFGILGMLLIAGIAVSGRKKAVVDMSEWAVSGRKLGLFATWILQAGETFTTFTFLGTVGLVVALGGGAYYAIPYVPLAYLGMYFIAPKIWRRARQRNYLTQADFIEDTYKSKLLGTIAGIVGIVILLPYLQLQITGLSLIIETATGLRGSGGWSAILGFMLVMAFVLWSGLGGITRVSYFKDVLMLLVIVGLTFAIPVVSGYGFFGAIEQAGEAFPDSLFAAPGPMGPTWVVSSMAISMISAMFYTLPHIWPAVMASKSEVVVRRNLIVLPFYNLLAVFPMLLAYTYILDYGMDKSKSNGAMLTMAMDALPGWVVGIILVAGAATAMVPAAAMLLSIAPLAVNNVLRIADERKKITATRWVVIVVGFASLLLALSLPNLLANMLLMTFEGSTQLVPVIAGVVLLKNPPKWPAALAGLVTGLLVTVAANFIPAVAETGISPGLIGLPFNIAAMVAVHFLTRNNESIPQAESVAG